MITWMQNNNKYLVITIWVATIAFIGAGFVGWGDFKFGSSASSVAKVGSVPISITKYSFNYNNLYTQKAREFNGKFDKKQAEALGLGKEVLNNLISEALILNFAKENGVIATDKEVGLEVASYNAFKNKNGLFDKAIYENFLKSRGLKAKDFEAIIKDEIIVRKTLKLLNIKPLDLEKRSMNFAFEIADKIKFNVIRLSDINITISDSDLKKYWEKNKLNYMTKRAYSLELLWTKADNINVSEKEIEKYYNEHSFDYTDDKGQVKSLKDVKEQVINDIKLSKIKKQAAIDRSRFKKGKLQASESVTLSENDIKFTPEIWKSIVTAKVGDYIKPKAVKDSYVTIHVKGIIEPKVMSFDKAKELVKKDLELINKEKELNKLAKEALKESSKFILEPKEYLTLSKFQILPNLTPQDSATVIRAIFNSDKKINSVKIKDGVVVYDIVEQKVIENNSTSNNLNKEIALIKDNEFISNFMKELSKRYTTEVYIKDIK